MSITLYFKDAQDCFVSLTDKAFTVREAHTISRTSFPQPDKIEKSMFGTKIIPQHPVVEFKDVKTGGLIIQRGPNYYNWDYGSYQKEYKAPHLSFEDYANAMTQPQVIANNHIIVDLRPAQERNVAAKQAKTPTAG